MAALSDMSYSEMISHILKSADERITGAEVIRFSGKVPEFKF
jgi:hypothetical protein